MQGGIGISMFLHPVIERELRSALRKRGALKSHFKVALLAAALVTLFFIFLSGSHSWGRHLHEYLFYGGLYLALIPPARISAGLFSEERRNQTFELLYLTGMSAGELFTSKLVGGLLIASCDLLALAPFLAIPFLSGGISLDLYLATLACLPALLLFIVAIGVLASVLCTDDGAALIFTIVLAVVVGFAIPIPFNLGQFLTGKASFASSWLCLSPAYGSYLVATNFSGATPAVFWTTTTITLAWALLFLLLAGILLKYNWRNVLQPTRQTGWRGILQNWIHGTPAWRISLREYLLWQNPYQWLVQRDRRPVLLAYGFIAIITLLWLLGWAAWPHYWLNSATCFLTAILLLFGINNLMLHAAAQRIGNDRRDGNLELLLTTPLTPSEIVAGQLAALRAQFKFVRLIMLALFLLMMLAGLLSRTWNGLAINIYLLIWAGLVVAALISSVAGLARVMWVALNTARPIHAVYRAQGAPTVWFWIIFNLRNIRGNFLGTAPFPRGTVMELVFTIVFAFFVIILFAGRRSKQISDVGYRNLITRHLHEIAQEPIPDPNDPLFKKWDMNQPFRSRVGLPRNFLLK
jgi:ABC-2 family transporter protein